MKHLSFLLIAFLFFSCNPPVEVKNSVKGLDNTSGTDDDSQALNTVLGDNSSDASINLALQQGVTLEGSVSSGRGKIEDILFDPQTKDYHSSSHYAEYGVHYQEDVGLLKESNPFFVKIGFDTVKNVDYITFGGAYPNQPQPHTLWKLQYENSSGSWITLESGKGGWIDDGILEWTSEEPIGAKAVRVIAYSDGTHPVKSIHLRGRGGSGDISSIKGALIQYRGDGSYQPTPEPKPTPEPVDGYAPYAIPPSSSSAVNVILDTDMAADVDDAGALATLHALADNGEANILGIMHNTAAPKAAGVIDAINTYYGRPNTPIGAYRGDFDRDRVGDFSSLADNYPNDVKDHSRVPDAVRLYREILSKQPDNSVTIISVGFLTNLKELLESTADEYSSLSGKELVERKVKLLSVMGGRFHSPGDYWEYNFSWNDVGPVTKYAIENWPTRVVFSGWDIGSYLKTGNLLYKTSNSSNPVREGYILFQGPGAIARDSWDQTAVLYGVRGNSYNGKNYWNLISGGYVRITKEGYSIWESGSSQGYDHQYLTHSMSKSELAVIIDELMAKPPKN